MDIWNPCHRRPDKHRAMNIHFNILYVGSLTTFLTISNFNLSHPHSATISQMERVKKIPGKVIANGLSIKRYLDQLSDMSRENCQHNLPMTTSIAVFIRFTLY